MENIQPLKIELRPNYYGSDVFINGRFCGSFRDEQELLETVLTELEIKSQIFDNG